MLQAKWKGGQGGGSKREAARAGQIRSFRIVKLDAAAKRIELEIGVRRFQPACFDWFLGGDWAN